MVALPLGLSRDPVPFCVVAPPPSLRWCAVCVGLHGSSCVSISASRKGDKGKRGVCQGKLCPGSCARHFCSYPIDQNLVMRSYLHPREARKCSLYPGRPCAQLKIRSSIKLRGRGNLIWVGDVSISPAIPFRIVFRNGKIENKINSNF